MSGSHTPPVGQLLFVSLVEGKWTSACERFLRLHRPGGILLSARGLQEPGSTLDLLKHAVRFLDYVPFLALEEEGGASDPLRAFLSALPAARAAALRGLATVERLAELMGSAMKLLGFNTNLAPVLDLVRPHGNILGTRGFDSDPNTVARCGEAFVRGLRRHGILPCAKHFPGLGGLPHAGSGFTVIGRPMSALWREDLVPYRELLGELALVMVSHAAYKAYDFDVLRPAVLSRSVLEGLLRIKLGYQGVALADLRRPEATGSGLEAGEASVQCIIAGCDMLVSVPGEKSAGAMLSALKRGLEAGRVSSQRLAQSLERIRAARKPFTPPRGKISESAVDQLRRQFERLSKECGASGEENQKIA